MICVLTTDVAGPHDPDAPTLGVGSDQNKVKNEIEIAPGEV